MFSLLCSFLTHKMVVYKWSSVGPIVATIFTCIIVALSQTNPYKQVLVLVPISECRNYVLLHATVLLITVTTVFPQTILLWISGCLLYCCNTLRLLGTTFSSQSTCSSGRCTWSMNCQCTAILVVLWSLWLAGLCTLDAGTRK